MYHCEFAKAYDFLGLWGMAKCHLHHQLEEERGYQCLQHYYSIHYFKLLNVDNIPKPDIIPATWFKYKTQDVDSGTKKAALKDLMNKWIEWEKSTKILYQELRQQLILIGEVAAALYIDQYICDVTKELCHAEKKLIRLETVNYDLEYIINLQAELDKKYTKKLKW